MATGAGYYSAALITTAGALLTLGPLRIGAYRIIHRFRPELERLFVDIPAGGSPGAVLEAVERSGGHVVSLEIEQEGDRRTIAAEIELRGVEAAKIVADVGEIDGVLGVRWSE